MAKRQFNKKISRLVDELEYDEIKRSLIRSFLFRDGSVRLAIPNEDYYKCTFCEMPTKRHGNLMLVRKEKGLNVGYPIDRDCLAEIYNMFQDMYKLASHISLN